MIDYYRGKIGLLLFILIPQLAIIFVNWHRQMLQGNWVELLFLELTIQSLYHYGTKLEEEMLKNKKDERN